MVRPVAAVLLLAALALAGCSANDDSPDGGSGSGSASAYVKDAPSDDFREVHVVFTQVSVHRSGENEGNTTTTVGTATGTSTAIGNTTVTASVSGSATATSTNASHEAGWIVLFSDAAGVDVDLLNTTGAKAAFLGEADGLDAGRYQQIRITIKEAYGIDHDGERVNITVSSGMLKSVRSFEVEDGMETRITIDIDLEKSLKQQGNGEWRMSPVIGKTTAAVVEDESSGEDTAQPGDVESVPETA